MEKKGKVKFCTTVFCEIVKGNLETLGSDCKFGHGNTALVEKQTNKPRIKVISPFAFQKYKAARQTDSNSKILAPALEPNMTIGLIRQTYFTACVPFPDRSLSDSMWDSSFLTYWLQGQKARSEGI